MGTNKDFIGQIRFLAEIKKIILRKICYPTLKLKS